MFAQLHDMFVLKPRHASTRPGATAALLSRQLFPELGRIESDDVDASGEERVHAVLSSRRRAFKADFGARILRRRFST
jgi:hypothetical protein